MKKRFEQLAVDIIRLDLDLEQGIVDVEAFQKELLSISDRLNELYDEMGDNPEVSVEEKRMYRYVEYQVKFQNRILDKSRKNISGWYHNEKFVSHSALGVKAWMEEQGIYSDVLIHCGIWNLDNSELIKDIYEGNTHKLSRECLEDRFFEYVNSCRGDDLELWGIELEWYGSLMKKYKVTITADILCRDFYVEAKDEESAKGKAREEFYDSLMNSAHVSCLYECD